MTAEEIRAVIESHKKWILGIEGGSRANLQGADLQGAYLQGADLQGADLWEADLQGANLQGSDLREADLQGANLREADLRRADLQGADLQGAYLQGADLQGADLQGADLQGADLRRADLQGADLREADLREADLQGANLREADLFEVFWHRAHATICKNIGLAVCENFNSKVLSSFLLCSGVSCDCETTNAIAMLTVQLFGEPGAAIAKVVGVPRAAEILFAVKSNGIVPEIYGDEQVILAVLRRNAGIEE